MRETRQVNFPGALLEVKIVLAIPLRGWRRDGWFPGRGRTLLCDSLERQKAVSVRLYTRR